jgi:F0F1-type ATP synthase assembly protein I
MRRPTEGELKNLRTATMLTSIAGTLVAATVIGYLIGAWLDSALKMRDPWFTVLFVVLGSAAGFVEMIRLITRAEKEQSD